MKEYPILFNTEMVNAILAGNKTQTRRLKAPWKVGDLLYVRENFRYNWDDELRACIQYSAGMDKLKPDFGSDHGELNESFKFAERCDEAGENGKWTPSIHMPKRFSRLRLRVTEMRSEKLQEITEADAEAEGIDFLRYLSDTDETLSPIKLFCALWLSCSKPGFRWSDNPDVIVTKFERVKA